MNLTHNEKTVLKFLIKNPRISDAAIAREMSISLQAVRNIRKKLEHKGIICGYNTKINYEMLGLNVFALAIFKVTHIAWTELKEEKIKSWFEIPNVIKCYRIPNGDITHIVKYAFTDINQMNRYFKNLQLSLGKYIEIINIFPLCNEYITDTPNNVFSSLLSSSQVTNLTKKNNNSL